MSRFKNPILWRKLTNRRIRVKLSRFLLTAPLPANLLGIRIPKPHMSVNPGGVLRMRRYEI